MESRCNSEVLEWIGNGKPDYIGHYYFEDRENWYPNKVPSFYDEVIINKNSKSTIYISFYYYSSIIISKLYVENTVFNFNYGSSLKITNLYQYSNVRFNEYYGDEIILLPGCKQELITSFFEKNKTTVVAVSIIGGSLVFVLLVFIINRYGNHLLSKNKNSKSSEVELINKNNQNDNNNNNNNNSIQIINDIDSESDSMDDNDTLSPDARDNLPYSDDPL